MLIDNIQSGLTRQDIEAPDGAIRVKHPVFWMRRDQSASVMSGVQAVPGASAKAIISEIEVCARRFAETGEGTLIDLRFLNAMPEEREILLNLLGRGEVQVIMESLGRTDIHETAVSCIWWVTHRNHEGETLGEMIEIASVPEVVTGDQKAVVQGLEARRAAWPLHETTIPPNSNAR